MWPEDTASRIKELALHHEDFRIEVHKELNNYNSAHAETWGKQIAQATEDLLGHDPTDLPPDTAVHIVSSNTHSVSNCLSPWLGQRAGEILTWAEQVEHPLSAEHWHEPQDLVYALAREYLAAHPELGRARTEAERETGILSLAWTAFTGIKVVEGEGNVLQNNILDSPILVEDEHRHTLRGNTVIVP